MPRTKLKTANDIENVKPTQLVLKKHMIKSYMKMVESVLIEVDAKTENEKNKILSNTASLLKEQFVKIPRIYSGKTIAELRIMNGDETFIDNTTSHKSTTMNILSSNDTTKTKKNNRGRKRSISDSRKREQSTVRKTKMLRASRSLSRSKAQTNFTTPMHQPIPPNEYGMVTPKMKPNTPQIVLRRPKEGEIAISMQGSPLMVSGVTSDQRANINIPLDNGRILTIQPHKGLRASQIPEMDEEIRYQLEILRDNLNKVCALAPDN